jgi:hypothetical protein
MVRAADLQRDVAAPLAKRLRLGFGQQLCSETPSTMGRDDEKLVDRGRTIMRFRALPCIAMPP